MNLDSMYGQNHDVYHEFPEYAERIDELRRSDLEFARLLNAYHELNREVIRVEQNVEPLDHFAFEKLKKARLLHKDRLYALLKS